MHNISIPGENLEVINTELLLDLFAMQKAQMIIDLDKSKTYTRHDLADMTTQFRREKFEELYARFGLTPDIQQSTKP